MIVDVQALDAAARQQWLQAAIAPRPIALASTINAQEQRNLAPFSFFNLFSAAPPVVVFSPARRVRDSSVKDTLRNLDEIPEVVIHICDFDMVQQVSIASCDYPPDVDEFDKAGFTPLTSTRIRPSRVAEAKIALECRVLEIKSLGVQGGAGNLVIAEVLCMHVDEKIIHSSTGKIDPRQLHHLARLGGDDYAIVDEQTLFSVKKPTTQLAMGFDQLPLTIRRSRVLSRNHLGKLAHYASVPEKDPHFTGESSHERAASLLDEGRTQEAWQTLLHDDHDTSHK